MKPPSLFMKTLALSAGVAVGLFWILPTEAAPMSTAFVYQGKLLEGGAPANGPYDLKFTLFDDPSAGAEVGSPSALKLQAVPISNGLFTVTLDFGAAAFDGADRWLQILVKPVAGTAATMLWPRQALTATPYALHAGNAATATKAATVSWSAITGIPDAFADGIDNDTTYTSGPGLNLSAANEFGVSFGGSGSADEVAHSDHAHYGQSWTGAANYGLRVQTTENQAFSSGLVGYQGADPLPIFGTTPAGVRGISGDGVGVVGEGPAGGLLGISEVVGLLGVSLRAHGVAHGVDGTSLSTTGIGVFGNASATLGATVGVQGDVRSSEGIGVMGRQRATTGTTPGVYGESASTDAGAVGILGRVTANLPGARAAGVRGSAQDQYGFGVHGINTLGTGVLGESASGTGIEGHTDGVGGAAGVVGSSPAGTGVRASSSTGIGLYAISTSGTAVYAQGIQAGADALQLAAGDNGAALFIERGAIRVNRNASAVTPVLIHRTTAANTTGTSTILDHPLTNGDPDAVLLVTQNSNPGGVGFTSNPHPVGVFYDGSHWTIFNEDSSAMPHDTAFNVMIIKR